MDNYTSDTVVQYLTNFSIRFDMSRDGDRRIGPPLLEFEYTQICRQDIVHERNIVQLTKKTLTHIPFYFQVLCTENASGFWSVVQILFSVVLSLSLFYIIFKIILYMRVDGQDGCSTSVILGCLGLVLDIVASALFLIAFCLGFYLFFAFKATASFDFPPEENMNAYLLPARDTTCRLLFPQSSEKTDDKTKIECFYLTRPMALPEKPKSGNST
jgi:hypothetical protein